MPGLLENCRSLYGTEDLYKLLEIEKTASGQEVKRAYHKLSLRVHPDRVDPSEKDTATQKFQVLGKVYTVLSDAEKRSVYDESGEVDDEDDSLSQDRDWYDYWRLMFSKISVKDIQEFEEKYKGSEEELEDLKSAYKDYSGDMESILDNVLCATAEDEERFTALIKDLIADGDLPKLDGFVKETEKQKKARKRKAAREAVEAEEAKKELGLGADSSLHALIAKRQESREQAADSFFSHLEAKYGSPKKKPSAKTKKSKK